MDQLKATPGNPLGLWVAKQLRNLNRGAKLDEQRPASAVWNPIVDSIVNPNIASEIENLSYGNTPMVMPQQSNIPQFKRGRAETAVDTALAALRGAGGFKDILEAPAKRKIMSPINLGTLAKMEPDLAEEMKDKALKATVMEAKGAKPQDIWTEHQLSALRTTKPKGFLANRWAYELPFNAQETPFKKAKLMAPTEKVAFIKKYHPDWIDPQGNLTQEGTQFMAGDIPKLGKHAVGSLFEVDALRRYDPDLEQKGVDVLADPKFGAMGQYSHDTDTARINLASRGISGKGTNSPFAVGTHELQHGVQWDTSMPYGGSAEGMVISKNNAIPLWEGATKLLQQENLPPGYKDALGQVQRASRQTPFQRYENLIGEEQARRAGARSLMSKEQRAAQHPGLGKENLDLAVWHNIQNALESNPELYAQDPSTFAPFVAEALRQYRK